MISVKELAKSLGISTKTVYALCDQAAIPFYRIGTGRGTLRFDLDEVKATLKQTNAAAAKRTNISTKHLL